MTAILAAQAVTTETLRRVAPTGGAGPREVAAELGCDVSAIAGMFPFIIDRAFVTVLAPAATPVWAADLITVLGATVVRRPQPHELLLNVELDRARPAVYMDAALLGHDQVFMCVDPPTGYTATAPETLREQLATRVISLPER